MSQIELRRGKETAVIEENILLGPSESNIKSFRLFCKELGAGAAFTQPLSGKSNQNFEGEKNIAYIEKPTKKLISELEKNDNVVAFCANLEKVKNVLKNSKKPVIVEVNYKEIDKIPAKVSGILINFVDENEIEADIKIIKKLKKSFDVVLVRAKFDTPEDIYNFLRDSGAEGIVIVSEAIYRPTIFEQTLNYFEKGYYNKLTRKKREKVVARFKKLFNENDSDSDKLIEFNQRFLEE